MSTLLLTLPPGPPGATTEYAYTLTADGHTATRQSSAVAALLPDPGRAGEVVALVPVQALSWHRVQLPPGQLPPARLRAALEGVLEERLLDDPAHLHFALQPGARGGEAAWVAVCDRAWLRTALQSLEAAGRPVARVVPEFAPGVPDAPTVTVVGTPEDARVVATGYGPTGDGLAVLPLSAATLALVGARPAAHTEGDAPADTPVRAEPAVAALAEQALGRPVTLSTASQHALGAARGPWDLAQFDLASSGRTRVLRKAGGALGAFARAPQWRAARWGAGVLVAAQLIGLNAWAWHERQSLAAKQTGIRQTLTQTFPQVQVVVDAPVQMERELALLRQNAGAVAPRDLEPLMAATAGALPAGRTPGAIEYGAGELRLRQTALSPEETDGLRQRLGALGYTLSQDNEMLRVRAGDRP